VLWIVVSVIVGFDYDTGWCCGDFERDDGRCGNMKGIQELLVPNACRTAWFGTECKSLNRELVYCYAEEIFLECVPICSIAA
jgi:hypothetical protein